MIAKRLTLAFHLCFGLLLCWLFAFVLVRWQFNSPAALAAALVLCALLCLAVRVLAPRVDALTESRFRRVFWAVALVYLALLLAAGWLLTEVLVMDMEFVYRTLPDFLDDFVLQSYDGYYMVCNNNLGLALLLAGWYKLVGLAGVVPGTDAGLQLGVVLNCLALWVTGVLTAHTARRALNRQSAGLLVLVLFALFVPLYLWSPVFYSDTLCMPFLAWALYLYQSYRESPRLYKMALLGLAAFAGFAVKGSLAVLPVAVLILLALERTGGAKQALRAAAVLLCCFGLLLGGYKLWQQGWLDWEKGDAFCYPTELWLCYGSHDEGDYSQQDVDDCNALSTVARRRELLRERIAQNYAARSLPQNWMFITHKAARTWGDGMFEAGDYLCTPYRNNWTARFTLRGQPGYMPLVYLCQAQLLTLWLLCIAGCLAAARAPANTLMLARLCLLGVMIFLSIWETKARYALHFVPVLLLCAAAAVPESERIFKVFGKKFSAIRSR